MNIFEYVPLKDIETLPTVCKLSRDILSRRNTCYWDSLKKEVCTPDHKGVTWGGSPGVTALVVKAAFTQTTCVVCKNASNSPVHRHSFYDVVVCNRCKHSHHAFRTMGFKTACRKFYLNPEKHVNDDRIAKIPRGSNLTVLENSVHRVASRVHPPGALKRKMEDRELRTELTDKRKIQNRDERMRLIMDRFSSVAQERSVRICPELLDFFRVNDILSKYNVRSLVYGDSCYLKVTSTTTTSLVVEKMVDFACLLTFMEKKGLVDLSIYPPDESCNPRHIFKRYLKNGIHYYETIGMYAEAKNSLVKREKKMLAHIWGREIDAHRREQLSRISCAEDGVEYDEYMFDNFVRFQVGNPVTIARKKRRTVYMNAHGYMAYYSNAMYLHGDTVEAQGYAEDMVMSRTMGLPPMLPMCIVDYC